MMLTTTTTYINNPVYQSALASCLTTITFVTGAFLLLGGSSFFVLANKVSNIDQYLAPVATGGVIAGLTLTCCAAFACFIKKYNDRNNPNYGYHSIA